MAANNTTSISDYLAHCNNTNCPIDESNYAYIPSLAANATLLALFAFGLGVHIGQGIFYRTWGFAIAFALGNITEIIGYVGRLGSHKNVFDGNAFIMQICCLTIAPAFFSAGIYLCLSRIVNIFGSEISRIPPKAYTYIFITCDILSLVLQAAGGAMASIESQNHDNPETGTHVMVAGLAFQVFTLSLFMLLCAEYAWRVRTTTLSLNPITSKLRASIRFRGFLVALALSTLLIYIRSIYRVIELAEGWRGALISKETYFIVLEGVMVIIAVLVLNVFHPGLGFQDSYTLGSGSGHKREKSVDPSESNSFSQ